MPFTIIKMIDDTPPPDTTAPVVNISAPEMLESDGSAVFTIDFNEALGTGANALTLGNLKIDGAATGSTPVLAKVTTIPETAMMMGWW